jgi:hypothetical protein
MEKRWESRFFAILFPFAFRILARGRGSINQIYISGEFPFKTLNATLSRLFHLLYL